MDSAAAGAGEAIATSAKPLVEMAASAKHSGPGAVTVCDPPRQPEVLWAQRSEKIYLTISLPDAKDVVLKTEPQGLFTFSAVANGEPFSVSLELFDSILPEGRKTRAKIGLRNIICSLQKEKKGWWKRLLKSEEKHPYIKVDWNKWCDDDEESASTGSDDDYEGANDGDESEDDEGMLYLPDLEKLRGK